MRLLGILLFAATAFAQTYESAVTYVGTQPLQIKREQAVARANDRVLTEAAVRIAIASLGNRALLVWTQADGSVMATRLDAAGAPVGFAFRLGTNASGAVAVAAGEDRYLVAWPSRLGDIYATVVSTTGVRLVPPMPVTTQGPPIGEIAAASMGNTFAIAWHVWPAEPKVFATLVDAIGTPSSFVPLLVTDRGAFPDVASNGSTFLVVWGDKDSLGIRGRTLAADGALGREQRLTAGDDHAPRVAWDGYAYSVAFARHARVRQGYIFTVLTVQRFSPVGALVGYLDLSAYLFPLGFDLAAIEGRVAVSDVVVQTFIVGPPPTRGRAVRH